MCLIYILVPSLLFFYLHSLFVPFWFGIILCLVNRRAYRSPWCTVPGYAGLFTAAHVATHVARIFWFAGMEPPHLPYQRTSDVDITPPLNYAPFSQTDGAYLPCVVLRRVTRRVPAGRFLALHSEHACYILYALRYNDKLRRLRLCVALPCWRALNSQPSPFSPARTHYLVPPSALALLARGDKQPTLRVTLSLLRSLQTLVPFLTTPPPSLDMNTYHTGFPLSAAISRTFSSHYLPRIGSLVFFRKEEKNCVAFCGGGGAARSAPASTGTLGCVWKQKNR